MKYSENQAPYLDDHLNDDTIPAAEETPVNTEKIAAVKTADTDSADGSDTTAEVAGETETDTDEVEEIKGSSEEQTTNDKINEKTQGILMDNTIIYTHDT